MNSQFSARTSQSVSSTRAPLKRLISTILAILVITGVPSVLTVANKRADRRLAKVVRANTTHLALGLTRQRGAFNKAISMLAEGAAANPSLAPYYHSLRNRMKGKAGKVSSSVDRADKGQGTRTGGRALARADGQVGAQPMYEDDSPFTHKAERETRPRLVIGDMNYESNAAIDHWTNHYAFTPGGRSTMMIGMERSNTYLEMARAEFRTAGVPEDLVWLAFVESVWNPRAVSPAAAGGLWQFMPYVATDYGLKVEAGDDERNDPAKQTRAAATYLHDLFTIFGDWHLSMAAYNSGEPRVMAAIVKNGRADFWELYDKQLLPKETCDYVPRILASIRIAGQAERYGFLAQAGS